MHRSKGLTLVAVVFGALFFVALFRDRFAGRHEVILDTPGTPAAPGNPVAAKHPVTLPRSSTASDGSFRHGPSESASKGVPSQAPVSDIAELTRHSLRIPIDGVAPSALRDSFDEMRGGSRRHEAIDILAPRGTPVVAVDDGMVRKLFNSVPGGLTLYEFDTEERFRYSYAHLDRYSDGMIEGRVLRKGDCVGYVGTTGNAPKDTPHLHFTIARLGADKKWWEGVPINPYPILAR